MHTDFAYIIMTEHYDTDNCTFSTVNQAVFLNEGDAIAFLNEHDASEFSCCNDDEPEFCVDVLGIGGDTNNIYDPGDKLQAAIDAANNRH